MLTLLIHLFAAISFGDYSCPDDAVVPGVKLELVHIQDFSRSQLAERDLHRNRLDNTFKILNDRFFDSSANFKIIGSENKERCDTQLSVLAPYGSPELSNALDSITMEDFYGQNEMNPALFDASISALNGWGNEEVPAGTIRIISTTANDCPDVQTDEPSWVSLLMGSMSSISYPLDGSDLPDCSSRRSPALADVATELVSKNVNFVALVNSEATSKQCTGKDTPVVDWWLSAIDQLDAQSAATYVSLDLGSNDDTATATNDYLLAVLDSILCKNLANLYNHDESIAVSDNSANLDYQDKSLPLSDNSANLDYQDESIDVNLMPEN